jgi:hypothetical protein
VAEARDVEEVVRKAGLTTCVVRPYRMSRPQERVRKAMGKCTSAGWMGLL